MRCKHAAKDFMPCHAGPDEVQPGGWTGWAQMDVGSAAEQQEPGLLPVVEDRGDAEANNYLHPSAEVYVCSASISCLSMGVQLCAFLASCQMSHSA